jgi:hypothetical protein
LKASQLPQPSAFVDIAPADLTTFGDTLVTVRQQVVQSLQDPTPAPFTGAVTAQSIGSAVDLLNTIVAQTKNFKTNMSVSPVGMLNLERLEMTPVGIERGGLVATIPLAPLEQTFVSQKEWSVTDQEFTSIVTDSLDNYSETGVTENTQLMQATSSQIAHNNQFNVTASASGGIGFVSGSTSTSFGSQDQNSQSAQNSRQDAVQTTRMASCQTIPQNDDLHVIHPRNLGRNYAKVGKPQFDGSDAHRLFQHDAQVVCRSLSLWTTPYP